MVLENQVSCRYIQVSLDLTNRRMFGLSTELITKGKLATKRDSSAEVSVSAFFFSPALSFSH